MGLIMALRIAKLQKTLDFKVQRTNSMDWSDFIFGRFLIEFPGPPFALSFSLNIFVGFSLLIVSTRLYYNLYWLYIVCILIKFEFEIRLTVYLQIRNTNKEINLFAHSYPFNQPIGCPIPHPIRWTNFFVFKILWSWLIATFPNIRADFVYMSRLPCVSLFVRNWSIYRGFSAGRSPRREGYLSPGITDLQSLSLHVVVNISRNSECE